MIRADDKAAVAAGADAGPAADSLSRSALTERALRAAYIKPTSDEFWHGRLYEGPVARPKVVWKSTDKPRADHECPKWLTASEFQDTCDVMAAKIDALAQLLRASRKTVLYTGAGISASQIGQAAKSGVNVVGFKAATREAQPTPTHKALAVLQKAGLIHSWIQQNHDGLPQKAGYPQHAINEIHGAWFDPSNPVIRYSGSLDEVNCEWLMDDAATADLVLVLGTSLSGLTADQLVTDTAKRSRGGSALGAVCINLQQTPQDGKMSLRLFGKSDNVLDALLGNLGLGSVDTHPAPIWPKLDRALVPYDADGQRLPEGSDADWMVLNLTPGAAVKLSPHHNCQGAKQPRYMHIGAKKPYKLPTGAVRQPGPGNGKVIRRYDATTSWELQIEGITVRVGFWWMAEALTGSVPRIPIVNREPIFLPKDSKLPPRGAPKP